jgi:hypothetical protein
VDAIGGAVVEVGKSDLRRGGDGRGGVVEVVFGEADAIDDGRRKGMHPIGSKSLQVVFSGLPVSRSTKGTIQSALAKVVSQL